MYYSPLRYPGGKGKLAPFVEMLIDDYGHRGGTYIEPFAGGAGIAIELLEKGVVSQVVINDLDKGVYSFWRAILSDSERFIAELERVPLTIEEWRKQHDICLNLNNKYSFELGFATFFMNRTNRSGIIKGGVVGGKKQNGLWRLDARFNKEGLINRIKKISLMKNRIHIYNKDIESFLLNYVPKYEDNAFIFFDPPYYEKGKQLYMNFFNHDDHVRIEKIIRELVKCDWIITYDNVAPIMKIYNEYNICSFELNYSAYEKRKARELMIFKNEKMIPSRIMFNEKKCHLKLVEEKQHV